MRVDRSYVSITKEKWGQKVPGLLNALFHERDPKLFVSTRCRRMWETVSTHIRLFYRVYLNNWGNLLLQNSLFVANITKRFVENYPRFHFKIHEMKHD